MNLRSNRKKSKGRKKILPEKAFLGVQILALLLSLIWCHVFLKGWHGFEETVVEPGETQFVAGTEIIRSVIPVNHDHALADLLDEQPCAFHIAITDSMGNVVGETWTDAMYIHTDGFTSVDNGTFQGLPIELNKGEHYNLYYEAVCGNIALTDLSFALYGNIVGFMWLERLILAAWFLLTSGGLILIKAEMVNSGAAAGRCKAAAAGTALIWFSVALVLFVSIPVSTSERDSTDFANAYAVSNHMMGKEMTDAEGYPFIDESGIRNLGYNGYDVPTYRFWRDWAYGNNRQEGRTSIFFRTNGEYFTPACLFNAVCISLFRLIKAPYQFVYLSGSIFGLAAAALLMPAAVSAVRGNAGLVNLLKVIFFLPAFILGLMIHSSEGLLVLAGILGICLFIRRKRTGATVCCGILLWQVTAWMISAMHSSSGIAAVSLSAGAHAGDIIIESFVSNLDSFFLDPVVYNTKSGIMLAVAAALLFVLFKTWRDWILSFQEDDALKQAEWGLNGVVSGSRGIRAVFESAVVLALCIFYTATRHYRVEERSGLLQGTFAAPYDLDGIWCILILFVPLLMRNRRVEEATITDTSSRQALNMKMFLSTSVLAMISAVMQLTL